MISDDKINTEYRELFFSHIQLSVGDLICYH